MPKPTPKKYKYARQGWDSFLDVTSPSDNRKVRDIVYDVARQTGIKPEILYSSAMEEGLQDFQKNGWTKDKNGYYIDGFVDLGLDNFVTDLPKINKYIPNRDMKYTPMNYKNEKGEPVQSAAFNNLSDALMAKAAYLRRTQDVVTQYAKDNNLNISDDALDFLSMAGYNGGEGAIPKMIKKYQSQKLFDQDKFLTTEPEGGYQQNPIYTNVRRRFDSAKQLLDNGTFSDFYQPQPQPQQQQSQQPVAVK